MIFISRIIVLIASCVLTLLEAAFFPDDGRLAVGDCLDKHFLRINNPLREVEDYLFGLCRKTHDDYNHIVEKFEQIGEDPKGAFDELKSCLKEHTKEHPTENADKLIERYKGFAVSALKSQDKFQQLTELVQVVIGLCAEKEWVTYEDLDPENKLQAYSCLEGCGTRLFKGFEFITKTMQNEYNHYLKQTDDLENQNTEIDEKHDQDTQTTDHEEEKKTWLQKVENVFHDIADSNREKYGYKKGIENYKQACENSTEKNIHVLTKIGKVWAEPYIEDMKNFYEKFHYGPIKFDLAYTFDSYLHCCRWKCAMGHRKDIPLIDWVIETKSDINATSGKLIME